MAIFLTSYVILNKRLGFRGYELFIPGFKVAKHSFLVIKYIHNNYIIMQYTWQGKQFNITNKVGAIHFDFKNKCDNRHERNYKALLFIKTVFSMFFTCLIFNMALQYDKLVILPNNPIDPSRFLRPRFPSYLTRYNERWDGTIKYDIQCFLNYPLN